MWFLFARFNPVVGGGPNAAVIHYSRNDQKVCSLIKMWISFSPKILLWLSLQHILQIDDGDLVLMDVGCELHGYVSDMTRTWPPSGSFSSLEVRTASCSPAI